MTDSIEKVEPEYSSERSAFISSVYEQVADDVACLFQRWPWRTVSRITRAVAKYDPVTAQEIVKHIGHTVTLTIEQGNALRMLRCEQCRTTVVI
jgi:hypothetical protein